VTDASLLLLHGVPVPWMPALAEGALVDPGTYQRLIEGNRQDALERLDQLVRDAAMSRARRSRHIDEAVTAVKYRDLRPRRCTCPPARQF
jgi:hypothetical protein